MDLEPNGRVELVDRVVRERLPRLEALAGVLRLIVRERVRERDRVERRVRRRGERRDDAERCASPRRGPEEVGVIRLGCGADGAVGGDDLERRDLVGEQAPRTRGQAEAALAGVAPGADVRAGAVR